MKAKQKFGESTVFGVPLGNGLYAIGLIARNKPRNPIMFGYFFGPPRKGLPTMSELPTLRAADAVDKCRFGYLGLRDGDWPVIGQLVPWNRDDWPMPPFVTGYDNGPKQLTRYSEDNPNKTVSVEQITTAPPGAIEDSLSGSGAVEIGLRMMFNLPQKNQTIQ